MGNRFVVDNSVVMAWWFEDETNPYADGVLDALADSVAVVPSIWPLEVVNMLLVAERRQRLDSVDSYRFLTLLSQLPIDVEPEHPQRLWKDLLTLGRDNNLSSYDAAYLDLALREDCPLATLDRKLTQAAKAVGVKVLNP
jgi:predicted nucleic acid-binding protein